MCLNCCCIQTIDNTIGYLCIRSRYQVKCKLFPSSNFSFYLNIFKLENNSIKTSAFKNLVNILNLFEQNIIKMNISESSYYTR